MTGTTKERGAKRENAYRTQRDKMLQIAASSEPATFMHKIRVINIEKLSLYPKANRVTNLLYS